MLHAKNLITHYYGRNADGPMDVQVYGRYNRDGLTIHGVALNNTYPKHKPPISLLPRQMDLVRLALVRLRKDLLNGEHIKITTPAGRPSIDAWYDVLTPGSRLNQCWRGYRLEWRPRGRALGSDSHPTLAEMEQALRDLKPRYPKWPAKDKFLENLGHGRSDVRRVNEWLKPHGLNYTQLVQQIYRAQPA